MFEVGLNKLFLKEWILSILGLFDNMNWLASTIREYDETELHKKTKLVEVIY